ncbi:Ig-like domain-containing protein [Shewanella baltica]|uniref:Ig-like domain-containing protein n=1 Tax=Shewanella baltica TaxID=62322 RepID=UPI003D78F74E
MTSILHTKYLILSLLLLLLSGCGDGSNSGFPSGCGKEDNLCVSQLTISPKTSAVLVSGQQSYQAIATLNDGSELDITDKVTWFIDDSSIATLLVEGNRVVATGITDGLATISASYHDLNASAQLLVGAISVSITPSVSTILTDMEQSYQAFAIFSNGLQVDVTQQVSWYSDNLAVASIGVVGDKVIAKGLTEGLAIISASYNGKSIYAQLNVVNSTAETLVITPASTVIPKGTATQYRAFLTTSSGDVIDVTTKVSWQVTDSSIATIDADAWLSALKMGSTSITASLIHNAKTLTAIAALTVNNAQLSTLAISPVDGIFPVGKIGAYRAHAYFSDGSVIDVTRASTWNIADPSIGTIIHTGIFAGDSVALSPGKTTVNASFNSITADTGLEVTSAKILNISISPHDFSTPLGTRIAYQAYARYSDGSKQDITQIAAWSSSEPSVAAIQFSGALSGVANTLAIGNTDITVSFEGMSKTTTLTVNQAVVESLQITPQNPSVPVGVEGQFTAIAFYSDKTTVDVTQSANWQVDDYSIAAVIPNGDSAGYAKALGEGTNQLSVKFSGQTASTSISVSAAKLDSISLTPSVAEAPAGTTLQYQLFGLFSDGTNHDLTTFANYQTSDNALASIDSHGLATAHQYNAKPVTMTASYNGLQATATLKVTAGLLDHIEVTPTAQSIAIGHKGSLQARAFYSDKTSSDITLLASWSVNDGDIASVDNTQAESGSVLGIREGVVTVTASFGGKTASNITTVTAAVLDSVSISPIKHAMAAGFTQQYALTAQFSDKTSVDVSKLSHWQSSDVTTASIDNFGVAQSYKEGKVSITGTYQGLSASANLTISAALLTDLQITPDNPNEPLGSAGYFTATAFFSNGFSANVTRSATWSSSDSKVVSIIASGIRAGHASADQIGTSTIRATYGSVSQTSLAIVTDAKLVSIVITPATASVVQGMKYQFTAAGIYSDNSQQDITNLVSWQTSDTRLASITSSGLAKGEQQGSVNVIANYQGKQAKAKLDISAPVVTRLVIMPNTAELPVGASVDYEAIAYDSTGKKYLVSNAADWRMVDQAIAHVDNTATNGGFVTSLAVGTSQIEINFAGLTQTAVVVVTPAIMSSLTISPADTTIIDGKNQAYTATAHFTNSTSLDVTNESSWQITNPDVATLSTNVSSLVISKAPGVTNIQATYLGITAQTSLTVQEKVIDNVQIIPHVNYLDIDEQVQLRCSIIYVDLSVGDCTHEALWTVSDVSIAHIEPSGGLVTGLKSGTTRVFASYHGVTSLNTDGQVTIR